MSDNYKRGAGVLCHISSLPNKYGIGSLGKEAYEFADILKKSHVKYWQVLPVPQTGYGDSPYQSVCCNSGNPYFIDLESLKDEGLIDAEELQSAEAPAGKIDYAALYESRYKILRLAYARFNLRDVEFAAFVARGEYEDYALFMSLKERFGETFDCFPEAYKRKENLAMYEFKQSVYKSDYLFWQFVQFVFLKQWKKFKSYVNSLGIKIIGDLPLYVAYDSCDVWGHPEFFRLDEDLKPVAVAGVPPDYFSEKGQLWGNPLYDWDALSAANYDWWIERMQKAAELYDIIRIDHFRGLERYYAIPADSQTAEEGVWLPGPGMRLFNEIRRRLGDLEIIAEDLGILDAGVHKLRARTGFPGMKILQFAFDGNEENPYLPKNIEENSVVYTGTHDNDTTLGFISEMTEEEFRQFKTKLRSALSDVGAVFPMVSREDAVLALDACALASKAKIAIIPVQDVLTLGTDARMNVPSTPSGNWQFRLESMPDRLHTAILKRNIDKYKR